MIRIGFIRHGQTAWNKEKRSQGILDIPLDEDGRAEAHLLAKRLSREEWDVLYSSDLRRAQQTTHIIGKYLDHVAIYWDSRLRERDSGRTAGTIEEERILKWGKNWREVDVGIESDARVIERGLSFVKDTIARHPEKNILIVSHGSLIKRVVKALMPKNDDFLDQSLKNTSVTSVVRTEEGWQMELHNCTKHLEQTSMD